MGDEAKQILYYASEGSSNELEKIIKAHPDWLEQRDHKGRNALFYAAMTDNIKTFDLLIKKGMESLAVDSSGASILHWAVQCGSSKVIKYYMSFGKPGELILMKDQDQVTPLHIAATKSNLKTLKMFIEILTPADDVYRNAQDRRGRSPLHYAACKANLDAIRALLEIDNNRGDVLGLPVDQKDKKGIIPLMCAVGICLPNALPVIRYLAKKKPVSKTRQNADGHTALHLAVASRNLAAVELLIGELQCPIDVIDNDHRTPLHFAAEQGYDELVTFLLENGARNSTTDKYGVTPAHYAAQFSAKCLEILLTRSNIPEVKDNEQRSCFMWAVCSGNINAIHYLIQRKDAPDRHAVDIRGYSALHLAAMVGNEHVCKILINQGWNISERDKSNNTALHLAVGRGHTDVVRFLVTAGANMNERDAVERTPVFWACLGGQSHTLHCMIKELGFEWRTGGSAPKPIVDAMDRTPLHAAAFAGFPACINVLLQIEQEDDCLKAPLVGWRDQEGKTALHEACQVGKLDCVISLLKHGAALNALDNSKRTPLDCALENQHKNIIEHLEQQGALTYKKLKETAATAIQRYWREKRIRRMKRELAA